MISIPAELKTDTSNHRTWGNYSLPVAPASIKASACVNPRPRAPPLTRITRSFKLNSGMRVFPRTNSAGGLERVPPSLSAGCGTLELSDFFRHWTVAGVRMRWVMGRVEGRKEDRERRGFRGRALQVRDARAAMVASVSMFAGGKTWTGR